MNCALCGKESSFELCENCVKAHNSKRTTAIWENNKETAEQLARAYYNHILKVYGKNTVQKDSKRNIGFNFFCDGINMALDIILPFLNDAQLRTVKEQINGMIEVRKSKKSLLSHDCGGFMGKIDKKLEKEMEISFTEHELAWNEFFKNKPRPKTDDEEQKQMIEFGFWYNNVRKQSDTGKTPAEMGERMLEYGEDNAEEDYLYEEAVALVEAGNFSEALDACNELIQMNPENDDAMLLKVEALVGLGRLEEIGPILEKCTKINPQNPFIHFHYASLYFAKHELETALDEINKALDTDRENFDFLIMKAQLLFLLNNDSYTDLVEKARKLDGKRTENFLKKLWVGPEEFYADKIAEGLQKLNETGFEKDIDGALEEIQKLKNLRLGEKTKEMVFGFEIECYFLKKDIEKAKQLIENLKAMNENNPHAWFYEAQVEFYENKSEKALETIEKCIAVAEKEKLEHFDYYGLKAEILKKLGNPEFAKWEEKSKKQREKNLKNIKKDCRRQGIKIIEKNGLIKVVPKNKEEI